MTREGRKLPPEFDIDMPAYDEGIVSHLQMTEMVEFLHSFEKPQTGKDLYFYYCENCHGPRGIGGVSERKSMAKTQRRWKKLLGRSPQR